MALQMWEIERYQSAAVEMCRRIGEDPYAPVNADHGDFRPQWFLRAERMAEFAVMIETMRNFGHL